MVEKLQQNRAVLKCAVHALPEEGNDGVGGVTDQERFCVHMPWRAFDRDHRAGRVVAKIVAKLRHQRYGVREICPEKFQELRFGIEAGKTHFSFSGQEQDAGKCAVNVGQCDQHVRAARPDVQRVRFKNMACIRSCRDGQLLIAVIEKLLRKREPANLEHGQPNCRRCAVRGDDGAGFDRGFAAGLFIAEARGSGMQIESQAAFIEMNIDASLFSFIHQRGVQIRARN